MALVGKPVTPEEIKKTCYTSIESINPSSINWDQVIGQGTYGIILGVIQDDDWVIKIANKKNSCTTLKHEYTFHNDAFLAYQLKDIYIYTLYARIYFTFCKCSFAYSWE